MKSFLIFAIAFTVLAVLAQGKVVELEAKGPDGLPLLHDDESHTWGINFDDIPHITNEEEAAGIIPESDYVVEDAKSLSPRARRSLSSGWTRENCVGAGGVAETWLAHKVMYAQSTQYNVKQYVTRGKGPYRSDCSGFVSACWDLAPPGATTATISVTQVSRDQMVRGDAFLIRSRHIAIFWGWHQGNALVVHESTWGKPVMHSTWSPSYWQTYMTVRRPGWSGSSSPAPNPVPNPAPNPVPPAGGSISVGSTVRVTASALNCRDSPSTSGRVLRTLYSGERHAVVDGPRSASGHTWWKIASGCWASGTYLAKESGPAPRPNPPPPPAPRPNPPPPPPPQRPAGKFTIGSQVEVTADSLNCRSQPSLSGSIVRSLTRGQRFTVTDGPVASGGHTWWKLSPGCWSSETYLGAPGSAPAPPPPNGTPGRCGGNCPGGRCPSCPCGTQANAISVADICRRWNGWSQSCCECIVRHESGGNANAMNYNNNGSFDIGVFQINQVNWASCNGGRAPCGIEENLACAKRIYQGRNSFKAWYTCSKCGCC